MNTKSTRSGKKTKETKGKKVSAPILENPPNIPSNTSSTPKKEQEAGKAGRNYIIEWNIHQEFEKYFESIVKNLHDDIGCQYTEAYLIQPNISLKLCYVVLLVHLSKPKRPSYFIPKKCGWEALFTKCLTRSDAETLCQFRIQEYTRVYQHQVHVKPLEFKYGMKTYDNSHDVSGGIIIPDTTEVCEDHKRNDDQVEEKRVKESNLPHSTPIPLSLSVKEAQKLIMKPIAPLPQNISSMELDDEYSNYEFVIDGHQNFDYLPFWTVDYLICHEEETETKKKTTTIGIRVSNNEYDLVDCKGLILSTLFGIEVENSGKKERPNILQYQDRHLLASRKIELDEMNWLEFREAHLNPGHCVVKTRPHEIIKPFNILK